MKCSNYLLFVYLFLVLTGSLYFECISDTVALNLEPGVKVGDEIVWMKEDYGNDTLISLRYYRHRISAITDHDNETWINGTEEISPELTEPLNSGSELDEIDWQIIGTEYSYLAKVFELVGSETYSKLAPYTVYLPIGSAMGKQADKIIDSYISEDNGTLISKGSIQRDYGIEFQYTKQNGNESMTCHIIIIHNKQGVLERHESRLECNGSCIRGPPFYISLKTQYTLEFVNGKPYRDTIPGFPILLLISFTIFGIILTISKLFHFSTTQYE